MKKILLIVLVIVVIFLGATYISVGETKDEFRTCQIRNVADIEKLDFRNFDSVTVAASTLYEASLLKEIMQGKQYRDAWAAPVTVPVIFLDTLKGGLKIIEEGGGMQTHSLGVEDSLGIRYTLRSLSKNPEKLVPDVAVDLGLQNIIIDGISAQHPYAALVVSELSEKANILHTNPKLMFVPKQAALGNFNTKFGNRLFLFEYESEGDVDWTRLPDIIEILDTEDLQELKLEKQGLLKVDKAALIRARLFDLIIGDWDRHAKQWGWAIQKSKEKLMAIPIAADRDNAFFHQEGVLPELITNDVLFPEIQAFEKEVEFLPGLVRPFDEYFLRGVGLENFKEEALHLQRLLRDETITHAFSAWPKSIFELHGSEIENKIRARRNGIVRYAEEFHKILNERPMQEIQLKGSEDLELPVNLTKCFDCFELNP